MLNGKIVIITGKKMITRFCLFIFVLTFVVCVEVGINTFHADISLGSLNNPSNINETTNHILSFYENWKFIGYVITGLAFLNFVIPRGKK